MQECKFVYMDLVTVSEHVEKCFPKSFNIFQLFEKNLKSNLENLVTPLIEKEIE